MELEESVWRILVLLRELAEEAGKRRRWRERSTYEFLRARLADADIAFRAFLKTQDKRAMLVSYARLYSALTEILYRVEDERIAELYERATRAATDAILSRL